MDRVEYIALKKEAITQVGANDKDSLLYYARTQIKNTKYVKWIALFLCITSFPAMLIIIGIPIFIIGLCLYFFAYRKLKKKADNFLAHVEKDTDF